MQSCNIHCVTTIRNTLMMTCEAAVVFALVLLHFGVEVRAWDVCVRTEEGVVGGLRRWAENGAIYASFRGVPYATQPLGALRFQELQPLQPYQGIFDATVEGPICPQMDHFFGTLMCPHGMSEACIHANIHVPIDSLPEMDEIKDPGLPIFVFIHGGGFQSGSGDSDIYGPEYLVSKGCIVITFNYRLNVFGFMSLNSACVPGNQGLRDMITLLKWVQRNARAFGGDPDNVTLAGQSAGSIAAHLLSLSPAADGLFKRLVLFSGIAMPSFYTAPEYQQNVTKTLLANLGITSTDPDEIHRQLIELKLDTIMNAYCLTQYQVGQTIDFGPVVESHFPGVTRILDEDPTVLIKKGRGKIFPLLIGFTDEEYCSLQKRVKELKTFDKIIQDPIGLVPPELMSTQSSKPNDNNNLQQVAQRIIQRYFDGCITFDKYLDYLTVTTFQYPIFKFAQSRVEMEGAPVFIYQFSYEADYSVIKQNFGLCCKGSAHIEDITFIFRVNSVLGDHRSFPPQTRDDSMKDWMTNIIINFIRCSDPTCNKCDSDQAVWPAINSCQLVYEDIRAPCVYRPVGLTERQEAMIEFFDCIRNTK